VVRENIVYNVTATYYSIQVLNDNLSRLTANITNLKKTTQINEVLKNNDLISDNIHNRMLINLENLQNQYENQKLVLDKNITQLKYLMNVDIHEPVTVSTFYDTDVMPGLDSGNISQRPDILLQHAQLKLSQFDKKSLAASYFPILTNTLSIGYTGYYDSFDPFKQINNDWIKNTSVTLSLKVPVFNGFRKQHQIRQKELAIQRDINTLSLMKSNADKEVQDATENYITNKKLLASNKKSLELAEQLFNSSQDEYENGITSVTEFLNAQNDLSTARTNYSTALLNLKLAELSLRKANGTLLTSR
jgi:outer membrane protein TolC